MYYRAYYTRRKFRPIYAKVMNKSPHVAHRNSASFIRYYGNALSLLAETLPSSKDICLFDFPFNELLVILHKHTLFSDKVLIYIFVVDLVCSDKAPRDGAADVATR